MPGRHDGWCRALKAPGAAAAGPLHRAGRAAHRGGRLIPSGPAAAPGSFAFSSHFRRSADKKVADSPPLRRSVSSAGPPLRPCGLSGAQRGPLQGLSRRAFQKFLPNKGLLPGAPSGNLLPQCTPGGLLWDSPGGLGLSPKDPPGFRRISRTKIPFGPAASCPQAPSRRISPKKGWSSLPKGLILCQNQLGIIRQDRKSTRLNSSHRSLSRMPSSA